MHFLQIRPGPDENRRNPEDDRQDADGRDQLVLGPAQVLAAIVMKIRHEKADSDDRDGRTNPGEERPFIGEMLLDILRIDRLL